MTVRQEDRERLMDLARRGVEAAVLRQPLPRPGHLEGLVAEPRGCFVTLTNDGRLRGCIGTFYATEPLALTVVRMAAEACRDPRFLLEPITPDELGELTVEVSVLSELVVTDDPASLEVGRHGIYVVRGRSAGCFLPEVATDMGWSAEQFLCSCCAHKAGLAPDAWRDRATQVYLFTSEKFSQ